MAFHPLRVTPPFLSLIGAGTLLEFIKKNLLKIFFFQIFAFQGIAISVGALCTPIITMLYAATLELYLGTVFLFSAAIIFIVLVITLYIYGYLNNLEKFSNSNNQSTILEANESLRGMSGLTTVV